MKITTTTSEKQFVEAAVKKGLRLDGRNLTNGRSIEIAFADEYGCCIVMQGNTRVLAQVTCEITTPKPMRPSEGNLHVNLELSPMADPEFKTGAMSDEGVEAARLLERCIRDSRCIDLESLCVLSGVKVWTIRVDIQALNNDGNIIECASVAAIAALAHFRRPHVSVIGTDVTVHSLEDHNPVPLTLHHMPIVVNLAVFDDGDRILVDPSELEERVASGGIVIGINAHQEICLLHFSGPVCLKKEMVVSCTGMAAKRAQTVTQIIRTALDNDSYQKSMNQPTGFTSLLRASTILGAKRPISQVDNSNLSITEDSDDDAEDVECIEDGAVENRIPEDQLGTVSEVRQEVQKFLQRPEVAIFEGGRSQWQLDEDSSEEEEETDKRPCSSNSKKDKKGNTTIESVDYSGDSSSEEEKVFLKSEHVDVNRQTRGWYSRNAFL